MPETTMQAAEIEAFGGPEQLQVREVPRPAPVAGKLLVRVKFASVNAMDVKLVAGQMKAAVQGFPFRPGGDFSGVVEAGPAATATGDSTAAPGGLPAGTEVFGRASGAYAQFVLADPDQVAPKPAALSFETAAALPVAAVTAWQAIHETGQVKPGQRVLIQGGSGGVGHVAVQLAKRAGAHVLATASQANAAFVRSLGADEVLDHHRLLAAQTKDLDLVVDGHGADSQTQAYAVLKPGGLLISLVGPPPAGAPAGVRTISTSSKANRAVLTAVAEAAARGDFKVTIAKVFPLTEAGAAQSFSRSGERAGKVLIQP